MSTEGRSRGQETRRRHGAREAEAQAINTDADMAGTAIATFDQAGEAMVAVLGQLAARLPGIDANFVPRMSEVTGDLGTAAAELVTVARAPIGEHSSSTERWNDVPRGTMDEVRSHFRLDPAVTPTVRPW